MYVPYNLGRKMRGQHSFHSLNTKKTKDHRYNRQPIQFTFQPENQIVTGAHQIEVF